MRDLSLRGAVRGRGFKTTIPGDELPGPADHVNRNFVASRPNAWWVSDLPGRCFARVSTRKLSPREAWSLLTVLGRERGVDISDAVRATVEGDKADRSLAAVFKIMQGAAAFQVPVPERASPS
jgi:hypothetical protein